MTLTKWSTCATELQTEKVTLVDLRIQDSRFNDGIAIFLGGEKKLIHSHGTQCTDDYKHSERNELLHVNR